MTNVLIALIALLFGTSLAVGAHTGDLGEHVLPAYQVGAAPAPVIDGRLDDEAWQQATSARGARQLVPDRGAPATDDTEFWIAYDRHHLFIAVRCYDAEPDRIINRIARRGEIWPSDWISLYIDPHHDHRTGYKFSTTPGGLQQDESRFDDTDSDRNWRGIWWVEARVDEFGWTAEFKIPFANFRFGDSQEQVWGFDFERLTKRKGEVTVWKQMSQAGQRTRMSDLGHITGLRDIAGDKLFEVTPYVLGGADKTHGTSTDGQGGVGVDLQYNLTGALKGNLTVNPDFAQVEADQLEINLTRFPTRFAEKRPFFVEGNNFFETPMDLFFSRRIGSRGDILWGSKLTGKVGDYSIGFLGSQTGSTDLLEIGGDSRLAEEAFYTSLRVKKDVHRRSNIGFLYTGKEMDGGHSRVAGVDANLSFADRSELTGQYAMSFEGGDARRNSALSVEVGRRDYLWDTELELERVEPLFEANETGFLNKEPHRGWQRVGYDVSYRPRWGRHQVFVGGSGHVGQDLFTDAYFSDWRQRHADRTLAADFEEDLVTWESAWWTGMELTEHPVGFFEAYYVRSREVELTDVFGAGQLGFEMATNSALPAVLEVQASSGDFFNFGTQAAGRQRQANLFGTLRPRSNLAVELGGGLARTVDGSGDVDGRFRVGSLRTTYLFTRDTFLRLFAQTERQRTYTPVRQTRTEYLLSILFGWEYSPKSHLFIAYNEDWGGLGGRRRLDDRVVVLKLSYLSNL